MVNRTSSKSQTRLGSTWQPLRGPLTRWPRAADAVIAMFVFLWSVFVTDEDPDLALRALDDVPVGSFIVYALASGALYWRRSRPVGVLGLSLAGLAVLTGLGYPNSVWALPFALYAVGRYAINDQWSYYGVGATIAFAVISDFLDGESLTNVGFAAMFVFVVWYIGRRIRLRGDYLKLLQARAAQLEREQDNEARRAVAEGAHPYRPRAARRCRPSREPDDGAGWRSKDRCGRGPGRSIAGDGGGRAGRTPGAR